VLSARRLTAADVAEHASCGRADAVEPLFYAEARSLRRQPTGPSNGAARSLLHRRQTGSTTRTAPLGYLQQSRLTRSGHPTLLLWNASMSEAMQPDRFR